MRLADTLRIKCGDVVAFVGAGGKSSAIRVLTVELSRQHAVLVTTTTKLGLAMINTLDYPLGLKHLENRDINSLAKK